MRYVVDIDGVLFHNGDHKNYEHATPIKENIDLIRNAWKAGHEIVLHTSRLKKDRRKTARSLNKHDIPYHSLVCGKPRADVYIDDKALPVLPNYGAKLLRKPLVICYSGGMDSVIAYWYSIKELKFDPADVILLNFDIGSNYSLKEKKARENLGLPFISMSIPLISEDLGNATTKDSYIIPGRNLIFATIASTFGSTVWIVGVKYEDHPLMFDKNEGFYRTASLACSQAFGSRTVVESPFQTWTKTEMIEWAMRNGLKDQLYHTVSCYHDTSKRCGDCGLCFKRAVAMSAAGYDERKEYDVDPFKSQTAMRFVSLYKEAVSTNDFSHYQKERILETFSVLGIDTDLV